MILLKSKRSTVFLIVCLLIAILLAGGLYYLLRDTDFSFLTNTEASAESTPVVPEATTAPPEPTEEPAPKEAVISLIGDCTLASSQYDNAFDDYLNKNGMAWPFSGTSDFFKNDIFTLANLECSFSDQELASASLFYFRAPAGNAAILAEGNVDCVTLGNNHTNDFGEQGILDTEAALDAAKINWVGPNDAKVFDTEFGVKIGVYCPGWTGLNESNIQSGISALQSAGADICIFAPHWGNEGSYQVSSNQEAYARIAIDAGAQIVCGTHPHVLQRAEEYNGGYIFYSLGNWSFGGNTSPRDRDTAIAQIKLVLQRDGTYAIDGYQFIPCSLSGTAGSNDFRPVPYENGTNEYTRTISKLDGSFSGPDLTVDYSFLN